MNLKYAALRPSRSALGAVARHRVVQPWLLPVDRALGEPGEVGRAHQMRQRPGAIVVDVADEAEFAARRQQSCHRSDRRILHEAPLPVPPLRPGIGMDQVDARKRTRRRPGQQFGRVAGEQADIADIQRLDLGQDLRHAVDIGLAADEARGRKGLRLRDQMLAAAEADFEPDILDAVVEQLGQRLGRGRRDVDRQMRQQSVDQVGLVRAQLVALAPSEERAARMRHRAVVGGIAIAAVAWSRCHRSVW
ncbi:hypothetical protein ACVW1B_006999 [Bradyrhizobium sp. USDA 4502]